MTANELKALIDQATADGHGDKRVVLYLGVSEDGWWANTVSVKPPVEDYYKGDSPTYDNPDEVCVVISD